MRVLGGGVVRLTRGQSPEISNLPGLDLLVEVQEDGWRALGVSDHLQPAAVVEHPEQTLVFWLHEVFLDLGNVVLEKGGKGGTSICQCRSREAGRQDALAVTSMAQGALP